jgi:hypothetical protein
VNFNDYSRTNLGGRHAFLSASKYHWLNYTDEKLDVAFMNSLAAERGTKLHAFAHQAIQLNRKQPATKDSLNMYVNDAIGYKMTCEQVLYYSDNCFGTADTISFRKNTLRIHDLKTGMNEASFHQLEIYAALFFLEYSEEVGGPFDNEIELRIYQNDEVPVLFPDPDDIFHIMKKIEYFDKRIDAMKEEVS